MRVPLSWLREFCDPGLPVEELADVLTLGGLEVEAIGWPTAGVRGVRVAVVEDIDRVPGSDRLFLVHVSDGEQTWQIVCGASNYAPGDRVPAALPGATLPGPDPAHPLRIERKELFGVTSNGMLASARELGVGEDHRGIWVLDADAPVGADLAEWLALDDPVIDLTPTPDRGYALSILGLARDIAALTGADVRLPTVVPPSEAAAAPDQQVPVAILDPDRCRRFDGRTIAGVRVAASPAWLQRRLAAAGMRPRSNVVDATNYAMLETGNPIHAYDLGLLAGPRIEVRTARRGEVLVTLDGVERALDPDDLVIADADGPVGLAGVMGGEATEINDGTADVFLEVANFTPTTVTRTVRRHGLHTDGAARWERTVPPETAPLAAGRCAELITATAGGRVVAAADHYPTPVERPVIRLQPARARGLLGMALPDDRQRELLEAIGCEVAADDGALDVTPPAYRPDLRIPADLCEEIARVQGYDEVPEHLPSTGQAGGRSPEHHARRAVREALAGAGWTEVVTFPFIADADLEQLGWVDDDPRRATIALANPLSKEESVLRTSLLPGLLRSVRNNVNRQVGDLALFETGRVFLPPTDDEPGADGGPGGAVLPNEPLLLGFAACGAFEPPRHDRPARPADLYDVLGAAELVRAIVGSGTIEVVAIERPPYHPGRAAELRWRDTGAPAAVPIGAVGELHPRVAAAFEVPPRTLVGELRLDRLTAAGRVPAQALVPSPLPSLRLDVAVVVDEAVPARDVEDAVRAGAGAQAHAVSRCALFDVFRGPQLGEGRKSLAYSLTLDDPRRQLTDADSERVIGAVEQAVAQVGGRLRR